MVLAACAMPLGSQSFAGDWSAKVRFNETIEGSDNRALNPNPAGATYLSTSRLRLDALTLLPTSSFEFNADISYQAIGGPGADQNASPTDNQLGFRYEDRLDKLTTFNLAGSWQRRDATTAQLADTGIVIAKGDINTFALEAGMGHQLSAWDDVRWTARGTVVEFNEAPGSSFYDVLGTAAWMHRLTAKTQLINSLQVELLQQDNPTTTESVIGRFQSGVESLLTQQLTFKGSAGVSVQRVSQDSNFTGTADPETDTDADGLADLQLVYMPTSHTELTLSAAHWTGPNVLGQIEGRTIVGAVLRQTINSSSTLWLRTNYTGQIPVLGIFDEGDTSYVRASVDYDYRLTPDWVAQFSYQFAHRADDVASANSNTLFLSAVYETTILP